MDDDARILLAILSAVVVLLLMPPALVNVWIGVSLGGVWIVIVILLLWFGRPSV